MFVSGLISTELIIILSRAELFALFSMVSLAGMLPTAEKNDHISQTDFAR